jgi:hypothetical protein
MVKDLSDLPRSDDRCVCKHAWTSHFKQIPLEFIKYALKNIDAQRSKPKHAWCVLCKKWCSTKNAPKDLI